MNEKRRAAAVRRLPYPGQFRRTKHDLVKAWLLSGLTMGLTVPSTGHWSNLEESPAERMLRWLRRALPLGACVALLLKLNGSMANPRVHGHMLWTPRPHSLILRRLAVRTLYHAVSFVLERKTTLLVQLSACAEICFLSVSVSHVL